MYIAIYAPDSFGRKILSGWEIYKTQLSGSPVPNKNNQFYSWFLSENKPMPKGLFEITESGILPLEYDENETYNLTAAKNDKISLINRRFEDVTERVAPAGYLIYLYTVSLLRDVDIKSIFGWLKILNERRVELISRIYEANSMEDLIEISDKLDETVLYTPSLPLFDIKDDEFTFHRTASSTYNKEITIPPSTTLDIPFTREKIPVYASLLVPDEVELNSTLTNHVQTLVRITPDFCYYKTDSGNLSANDVLSGWDDLTPEKSKLEVILPTLIKPSSVSIYVDKGEPVILYVNSEPIYTNSENFSKVGDVYKFEVALNYGVTKLEWDLGDNTKCGQLSIFGHVMSNISMDKKIDLTAGIVSLNSADNLKYEIYDSGKIIYSGQCNGQINDLTVGDESYLKVYFEKSDTVKMIYVNHVPDKQAVKIYPLSVSISSKRDTLNLSHSEPETLTGTLYLTHPIPV